MSEPKDITANKSYMGFTNHECPFYPCHAGVKREFNCLMCFCPVYFLECPGPYLLYTDSRGQQRKDCTHCTLPHDGYEASWKFIQKYMNDPVIWTVHEQNPKYLRKLEKMKNENK